jgi:hypothetical protein
MLLTLTALKGEAVVESFESQIVSTKIKAKKNPRSIA